MKEAIQEVPRQAFKDSKNIKVGEVVRGEVQDQSFQATVIALTEEEVTLDMNHPLAGKTLKFEIEVVSVE